MRARLLAFLFCLLPLAGPAQDVSQSDADRGFLVGLIEDNLSGAGRSVRIDGFAGALSSRATFDRMTIADADGVWLVIRGGAIAWNRSALLSGRIEIAEMSAAEIDLPRAPKPQPSAPSAEAPGFALPELPVSVTIGALTVDRLRLGEALFGAAAEVSLTGAMALSGGAGTTDLAIRRIDGPSGEVSLTGAFANETGRATLDLLVEEGANGIAAGLIGLPGRPAITLALHGAGTVDDFKSEVALSTDGASRLTGTITLTGAAGAHRFAANIGGDVAPLFMPEYRDFFGPDIRLEAEGQRDKIGRLDLSRLILTSRAVALDGRLVVGAGGLPEFAALKAEIGLGEGGGAVLLPLTGPRTWLDAASLDIGFDAARGDGWRMAGRLDGLRRDDIAIAAVTLDGSGRIARPGQGGTAAARVGGTLKFAAAGIAPVDADLAAALGPQLSGRAVFDWQDGALFRLPIFDVTGEGYGAKGGLTLSGLDTAFALKGRVEARIDDMARYSGLAGRRLGGSAVLTAKGDGAVLAGRFDVETAIEGRDLSLDLAEIDGLLAGRARISASVRRDSLGTQVRALDLAAQSLTASVSGDLKTGASDLTARLDFADLSVLGPDYHGRMHAEARLREAGARRMVTLDGEAEGLAIGQAEADRLLAGTTDISLAAGQEGSVIFLDRFHLTNPELTAEATGRIEDKMRHLTLSARLADLGRIRPDIPGTLTVSGRVDEGPQGFDVAFDAAGPGDSTVRLAGLYNPGSSDLRAALSLGDLWALGGKVRGRINAEATLREAGARRLVTLGGKAEGLAIGQAEADRLLAGTTDISLAAEEEAGAIFLESFGLKNPQLAAEVSGTIEAAMRKLQVSARLADLAQIVPGFPGPLTVSGSLNEGPEGFGVDLTGEGPGAASARIAGTLATDFSAADLKITGSAQSGLINPFIEPRNIEGPLTFDLRLAGPPEPASLSGRVTLSGGRIVAPRFGIALQNTSLSADLGGGQARLSGSGDVRGGRRGGGRVTIDGPVSLAAPYPGDLTIGLDSVRLRQRSLYDTRLDGTIGISGPLTGGAMIRGSIGLGRTEIRVPSGSIGGAAEIGAVTHLGEPPASRLTRERAGLIEEETGEGPGAVFSLDLAISAPDRIFVRGRGLDAELGGALRIGGTTDEVVPSGQFDLIRGRLDLLGKRFTIDEGQVQLQGALVPYIRFVATTRTSETTATVTIEGEATAPEVHFTSDDGLPEEEVISQILFGRGLDRISAFQAAQLASAVATLAGRGGDGVVGRLRKSVGLDDLDVQTDETGAATLRAGKYISDRVYTDVAVGADGKSEINLNLDLRRDIKLRGTLGSDGTTGVGVFYERDY